MARDLPIGNGSLLVAFDTGYRIRDLFFPHVGQENHVGGHLCRFGFFVDGRFSWVGTEWRKVLDYEDATLVTQVRLAHEPLALTVECRDAVDFHENVMVREVRVRNLAGRARVVKAFLSHDFHIGGVAIGNTAFYDPQLKAIIHYCGPRYLLANVSVADRAGVEEWATGTKEFGGREGTWRDAEDGRLEGNPIAQGSVDSTIAVTLPLGAGEEGRFYYWLAAGTSYREVQTIDAVVRDTGPAELLTRTAHYWRAWLSRSAETAQALPSHLGRLYRRSLLIIRTHVDHTGGIVAATDSDVLQFGRDTYNYVWPRDGALTAAALDAAGYGELSRQFFVFCGRVISGRGYFLHKYNPDGSVGSSWHPWYADDQMQLPIQEDETALVLWALWRHFERWRDVESLKPLYRSLIVAAAEFLADYRDPHTGLPLPSYDLWEERRGVATFTAATVVGGLAAAANFADLFGDTDDADRFRAAAEAVRAGMARHLFVESAGRFARSLTEAGPDLTVDASLAGVFAFGAFAPSDPRVNATMDAIRESLWVKTVIGGCARYEGDAFERTTGDPAIPGNPWIICTLWLARHALETATREEELEPAWRLLDWVAARAAPSGVLPEQVDPFDGAARSVTPLTWSHAEFIWTARRFVERRAEFATLAAVPTREEATRCAKP